MPWLLLLLPVGLVGWFLRPAVFRVTRSRFVARGRDEVFELVRDLRSWPRWSPWLICESEAKVDFTDDAREVGGKYSWDGEIVGTGEIEHTAIVSPGRLEFVIRMTRPYKSEAEVTFEFADVDDGTQVTWSLEGRMPAALHRMIRGVVGADYERGLAMLADVAERDTVRSRLDFHGVVDRPALNWIGLRRECAIRDLSLSMREAFGALEKRLTEEGILAIGPWMTIYERYNLSSGECAYVAAAPVGHIPVPEGMASGSQSPHRALGVTHYGPYEHLGNPWAAAYQHVRAGRLKARKRPAPYELYVTGPGEVADEDIRTDVFTPVA